MPQVPVTPLELARLLFLAIVNIQRLLQCQRAYTHGSPGPHMKVKSLSRDVPVIHLACPSPFSTRLLIAPRNLPHSKLSAFPSLPTPSTTSKDLYQNTVTGLTPLPHNLDFPSAESPTGQPSDRSFPTSKPLVYGSKPAYSW